MISPWLKKWFWIGVAALIVALIAVFTAGASWWWVGGVVAGWAALTFVALIAGFDGKPING